MTRSRAHRVLVACEQGGRADVKPRFGLAEVFLSSTAASQAIEGSLGVRIADEVIHGLVEHLSPMKWAKSDY